MNWRESMGVLKSKPPSHNSQNTQKGQTEPEKKHFADYANIANAESKIKKDQTQPPDIHRIHPDHRAEYRHLWCQADELAGYVDGDATREDRLRRMPELNAIVDRMKTLEDQTGDQCRADQAGTNGRGKKIPGLPDGYIQAPVAYLPGDTDQADRETCPACGENFWWRLDKPNSKRICGRCHPAANGLNGIHE